jgi:protein O-mannosyl-transferase
MSVKNKKTNTQLPVTKPPITVGSTDTPFQVPKFAILLLLLITAIIYSSALQNGITYIDDDMYLYKNPYLRDFSFEGVKAIFTSFYEYNYHPLTTLSWWAEYKLFEFNPLPYHAFNVVLHLINTWLVYTLTARLSGRSITAIIVAALFALHPMHVESVVWISERKGLLCALFYFIALLQYLKYTDSSYQKKHYILCLLAFLASLLSKSAAVTLPILMIVIDVYKGRKIEAKQLMEKLPFLLLAVLFGVLAIMSQRAGGAINDISATYGTINRLFLFTSGIAFYFINLFAPLHLSALHYFPNVDNGMLPLQYYASLPLLILMFWLVIRKSTLKKELVFGTVSFLVSVSVMLQIITVGSALAAERYTYVSYFGLFYIAGQWMAGTGIKHRSLATGIFSATIVVFALLSWKRIGVWKDTDTLFTDIIAKNPNNNYNYLVHYHWGESAQEKGAIDAAINHYSDAIEINQNYQNAYLKRGEVLDASGKVIYAILDFNEAIRINPKSAIAYNNKGWAYFEIGDRVLSIANLDTAIMLDSKLATAYNNRGWAHLQYGDTVSAIKDFNKAIIEAPTFTKPYYNRALIKSLKGDYTGAINEYSSIIKIHSNDDLAYYNRGLSYLKLENKVKAKENFTQAASLGNNDARDALNYMK